MIRTRQISIVLFIVTVAVTAGWLTGCAVNSRTHSETLETRGLVSGRDLDLSEYRGVDYTTYDTEPAILDSLPVLYPEMALASQLEGAVRLEVAVHEDGTPVAVKILDSAHPIFDKAVIEAVAGSRFTPAIQDGQPSPGVIALEYVFRIEEWLKKRDVEPVEWSPPMLSEVASLRDTLLFQDGAYSIYEYKSVLVHGDIAMAAYGQLMHAVAEIMGPSGIVKSVFVYISYPESAKPYKLLEAGDVMVSVCADPGVRHGCHKEMRYMFVLQGGKYELWKTGMVYHG